MKDMVAVMFIYKKNSLTNEKIVCYDDAENELLLFVKYIYDTKGYNIMDVQVCKIIEMGNNKVYMDAIEYLEYLDAQGYDLDDVEWMQQFYDNEEH